MVDYKPKGFKAVLVSLSNSEVHVYKEKYLVDVIKTPDVVTGMRFGRFGREDGALVMTTSGEYPYCIFSVIIISYHHNQIFD